MTSSTTRFVDPHYEVVAAEGDAVDETVAEPRALDGSIARWVSLAGPDHAISRLEHKPTAAATWTFDGRHRRPRDSRLT
jgi:hypothetical protein